MVIDNPGFSKATNLDYHKKVLEEKAQGKWKVDQPRETWRKSIKVEIETAGMTWAELRRMSQKTVYGGRVL